MTPALRGLESKTTDPYLAGWRKRIVPSLGHLPVTMITNGAVDRTVHAWIADGCSRPTVKNTLAVLVRVMEQALRDGIIDRNPARVSGWQREYKLAEDELDDPRSLALPDWSALVTLPDALVANSADLYQGWGDVVVFEAQEFRSGTDGGSAIKLVKWVLSRGQRSSSMQSRNSEKMLGEIFVRDSSPDTGPGDTPTNRRLRCRHSDTPLSSRP